METTARAAYACAGVGQKELGIVSGGNRKSVTEINGLNRMCSVQPRYLQSVNASDDEEPNVSPAYQPLYALEYSPLIRT